MGAPIETSSHRVRVTVDALKAFNPQGLGVYQADFRELIERIDGKSQSKIVEALELAAEQANDATGRDVAGYLTAVLVLRDYILGGYYPLVSNGQCFLASIWDSNNLPEELKRLALRRMYESMRERDQGATNDLERLFAFTREMDDSGDYSPAAVLRLLDADALEPELHHVADNKNRSIWKAVRATWSMTADRSAPGREVSFMLTDRRHSSTPIGILQFRNVVPEIKSRDTFLGLVVDSSDEPHSRGYMAAVRRTGDVGGALTATADTLESLLRSVNPLGIEQAVSSRDEGRLREISGGSRLAFNSARKRGESEQAARYLVICKRAETAADLCRGINSLRIALQSRDPIETLRDPAIAAKVETGLRKIWHYHMGFVAIELSICGAAPPFNAVRAGKLMASLAGSKEALAEWGIDRPLGQIAQQTYLPEVRERVPNPGPLVLLTSGLYPGHSAQYTRVRSGDQLWLKYGETSGYGSFHISTATMKATGRLNGEWDGYRHITRAFGEGSGARFREVGRALDRLNLPDLRRHDTRRPLYALALVPDVPGVLFGWARGRGTSQPHVADLVAQWRKRWFAPRQEDLIARAAHGADLTQTLQAARQRRNLHRL